MTKAKRIKQAIFTNLVSAISAAHRDFQTRAELPDLAAAVNVNNTLMAVMCGTYAQMCGRTPAQAEELRKEIVAVVDTWVGKAR